MPLVNIRMKLKMRNLAVGDAIRFPESSCVACRTTRDYIILVHQKRPLHDKYTLEIPGGKIETGESPQECAAREMAEEIGIKPSNLDFLLVLDLDFSASIHRTHIFTTLIDHQSALTDGVVLIPIAEANKLIMSGKISHAPTVVALLSFLVVKGKFNEP